MITGIFLPLLIALTVGMVAPNTSIEPAFEYGGILGKLLADYLVTVLGRFGTYLFALGAVLISIVLTTNLRPSVIVEFLIAKYKYLIAFILETPKAFERSENQINTKKQQKSFRDFSIKKSNNTSTFLTPKEREAISKALEKEEEAQNDPLHPSVNTINKTNKTFPDSNK